jgi:hypothetical protein
MSKNTAVVLMYYRRKLSDPNPHKGIKTYLEVWNVTHLC